MVMARTRPGFCDTTRRLMLMEDRLYKALVIAVGILSVGPAVSRAATVRLIANMVQGATPNALIEGSPGLFYLLAGGPNAIISVSTHGTITTLASFPDPGYILESNPGSIAANGLLYSSVANSPTVGNFVFNVFSVGTSASSEQI